ncbi:MAG: glycosyltransferase family 9 protein [Bacteroidales bacterium]|nr:glycosyltransferase family 9 protein [Bacteroidales bacterium]
MRHLLVIRFSALGDVAMSVPIIRALAETYPDITITMLSKKNCAPLFSTLPNNVQFIGADFKEAHHGNRGWQKLMNEIELPKFDAIADLHGSLRSRRITLNAWLKRKRTATIDKGRHEKRKLTRKNNKTLKPLKPVTERYTDVFTKLGLPITVDFQTPIFSRNNIKDDILRIGIAPFAQHTGKIYPLELMQQVVEQLSGTNNINIMLFGAGSKEMETLHQWRQQYPHTQCSDTLGGMANELNYMGQLNTMLTMDSANMHMAALAHTPTVSIWGATHPYCGFTGWQTADSIILQQALNCRPCSIYGNKICTKGNYSCMHQITPQEIVDAVLNTARHNKQTQTV